MTTGIVNIHGKQYKTVALRVSEFRSEHPDYTLKTEIIESGDPVIMKATIATSDNAGNEYVIATGHAEELRSASQINRTSALENCETSAIGRALAAFGLAGSEFASADEVANAIHQQSAPKQSGLSAKRNKIGKAILAKVEGDPEAAKAWLEENKLAHVRTANEEQLEEIEKALAA